MSLGTMRVYGCGGAGINIAHHFNTEQENSTPSATMMVSYVDTSYSNINEKTDINQDNCYVLGGEGSGKIRKQNYDAITETMKQVLLEHKPGDFNVVVFSGSGGSGSVIGPLLAQEILRKGIPVVCVVVGSDESTIAASNTLYTLKTLEGISKNTGQPVVMHYRHNRRGKPRSEVDEDLIAMISSLAVLASNQIAEIDSRDVSNLLYFNKVTTVEPALAAIEVVFNKDEVLEDMRPHSVVSIYESPDKATLDIVPEYHCAGYAKMGIEAIESMHFLVDIEIVSVYVKRLKETIDQLDEVRESRVQRSSIADDDEIDDNGMVL